MRRVLVPLLAACVACTHARPAAVPMAPAPPAAWAARRHASARTLEIAALALATGGTATAFGGGLMGTGKALGPARGEPPFWLGAGTLIVGLTATTVGLVVLAVAGIEYAGGD